MYIKILRIISLIYLAANISSEALSQGFDWQYSTRMPSANPNFFIGPITSLSADMHAGSLNFSENLIPCCRFKEGSGYTAEVGILSEIWMNNGNYALNLALSFSRMKSEFEANPDPVYYRDDTLYTKLLFTNTINYFDIDAFYKKRMFQEHFYYALGAKLRFVASNNFEHKEKTIGDGVFNNGMNERKINSGEMSELSFINIYPTLKIGYDLNLGLGLYASPFIDFSFSLLNQSKEDAWKNYNFRIGVSVLKGFL
jgi:hypothetical protein